MIQKQVLLSSQESTAHAAQLSKVESVPHFPAPFSKDIISSLAKIHTCDIYCVESQSSAVISAVASSLTEKRVFLPLSKIRAFDSFQTASSLRSPLIAVNIGTDHFVLRDSGWLMFFPATNQEIVDTIIQAYMVSEDRKVLLPAMINIDMQLTEPVFLPNEKAVANMLAKIKLPRKISIKDGIIFNFEERNNEQIQKAMENAIKSLQKNAEKFDKKFKRSYQLVENFMVEDAEYVFVLAGYQSQTAKAAIKKLRQQGEKIGLLRLRVLRPWPSQEISKVLTNAKRIAVIDQSISLGASGILHTHIKASASSHISSFIAQKRLNEKDFFEIFSRLKKEEKPARFWL